MTQRLTPERIDEIRNIITSPDVRFMLNELLTEIDAVRGCSRGRKACDAEIEQLTQKRDYLESERKHWRDECEKVRQERDQLKVENERLNRNVVQYRELRIADDKAFKEENQKLRERVAKLRETLEHIKRNDNYSGPGQDASDALAADDALESEGK